MNRQLYVWALSSQLVLTAIGFIAGALTQSLQHAMSFAIGGTLMAGNLWLLNLTWSRVLLKKSIALAFGVIVIKWTLFAAICIFLVQLQWLRPDWLMAGIASIIVSALVVGWRSRRKV